MATTTLQRTDADALKSSIRSAAVRLSHPASSARHRLTVRSVQTLRGDLTLYVGNDEFEAPLIAIKRDRGIKILKDSDALDPRIRAALRLIDVDVRAIRASLPDLQDGVWTILW